jgi:hypothetical protein
VIGADSQEIKMSEPLRRRSTLLFLALAVAAAGCAAPRTSAGSAAPGKQDFWELLTQQSLDYEYHPTLQSLWEASDTAEIGTIRNVREGRGLGGKKGQGHAISTVILTFEIMEHVRGDLAADSRRIVDIEWMRPDLVSVRELNDAAPHDHMLVLLKDTAGTMPDVEIDESGADRDPGKTLYTLTTSKALFIEVEDGLLTPLDSTPDAFDESYEATTLQELAEEIRSY